jgi:tetratricopeptide (TPR) repeat protein
MMPPTLSGSKSAVFLLAMMLIALFILPCGAEDTGTAESTPVLSALDYYTLGVSYAAQGRYESAVSSFEQAIEADPENYRPYFALGQSLAKLGDHEAAIAAYDRAIGLSPRSSSMITAYRQISLDVVYPQILSGSILKGTSSPGWQYLTIDNTNGMTDVVVAFTPDGMPGTATTVVYVVKGDLQTFYQLLPPAAYDVYITVGDRWNSKKKMFDKNAAYLMWETPQYFEGLQGNGYTMTFVSQIIYPNWWVYNLAPIQGQSFPAF